MSSDESRLSRWSGNGWLVFVAPAPLGVSAGVVSVLLWMNGSAYLLLPWIIVAPSLVSGWVAILVLRRDARRIRRETAAIYRRGIW